MPNPEKIKQSIENIPTNEKTEKWQPLETKDWPQDIKDKIDKLNIIDYSHNIFQIGQVLREEKDEILKKILMKCAFEALARIENLTLEQAKDTIEKWLKDEDRAVQQAAIELTGKIRPIDKSKLIKKLITSQEPALQNPYFEYLFSSFEKRGDEEKKENLLLTINDIVDACIKKYPQLIGLIVLGSFAKGYWVPASDLDWALIFNDKNENGDKSITSNAIIKQIKAYFSQKMERTNFKLCLDHSFDFSKYINGKKQETQSPLCNLFNGLFFGNRNRLKNLQKYIVNECFANKKNGEKQWDAIRQDWCSHLENYKKMIERFGLTQEETAYIINRRAVLWGLPDLETMKNRFDTAEEKTK